ncbi:MAG TPA: response regulator [Pirellulales bacterium]
MNPPSIPNLREAPTAARAILLVDDNVEFLEVLARRFTRRGFAVTACTDAVGALAAARRGKLDVAIIDRALRGGDGIELLRQLKRENAALPVIVLSGSSDKATMAIALESGAFAYFEKPCSLADLEAAVSRCVSS